MAVAFKFDSDVEIPYKAAFFLMTSRGRPFCLQNKVQLYKGLCRNASCNSQIKNENEAEYASGKTSAHLGSQNQDSNSLNAQL